MRHPKYAEKPTKKKKYAMETYSSSKFVVEPEALITPTMSDVKSDEAVWKLYDRWCLKYRNMTKEKKLERFSIFKERAIELAEYNREHPICTWSLSAAAYKTMEELDCSRNVSRRHFLMQPTESDMKSDEAVWKLYRKWCHHYKEERSEEEMQEKFSIFKNKAIKLVELNKNCGSISLIRTLPLTADTMNGPKPKLGEGDSDLRPYLYDSRLLQEELQKRFPKPTRSEMRNTPLS